MLGISLTVMPLQSREMPAQSREMRAQSREMSAQAHAMPGRPRATFLACTTARPREAQSAEARARTVLLPDHAPSPAPYAPTKRAEVGAARRERGLGAWPPPAAT